MCVPLELHFGLKISETECSVVSVLKDVEELDHPITVVGLSSVMTWARSTKVLSGLDLATTKTCSPSFLV